MTIEVVQKRNGELEKFDINKILRWELWACNDVKQYIDWKDIIIKVKAQLYDRMSTQDIMLKLIEECNNRKSWFHSLVAGRLYAAYITKKLYGSTDHPTLKDQHEKMRSLNLMSKLDYTDQDYAEMQSIIDHSKDYDLSYLQIYHMVNKYGLSDRVSKIQYETPQFIFGRMAMALAEDEKKDRLKVAEGFYKYISGAKINAPTPNYVNLGTPHNGYISCCLYTTDDTAASIGVGDHIAYTMTYMSAGIGGFLNIRSLKDKVKNGMIRHMGKLPYFKSVAGAVNASLQSSRGGACTQYFTAYDPEATDIAFLQNPRTPIAKQNRDLHFAMMFNTLFVEKFFKDEKMFTFNKFTAPDLMEAFFSGKPEKFKEIYLKYENDPSFVKNYVPVREFALTAFRQSHEVATLYQMNADEVNRHTPFKEPIYQSNLCLEILQPTKPYYSMEDLYSTELHERGEISLCALGGIVPSNINSDEEYEEAAYYSLLMIDKCIHKNHYVFPHLELTAKARMNAAVGMIGIAHELARKGLKYNTKEGLEYIHFLAERHMYYLIKASLKLGKELGNAPWMHKTKWPEGWMPIDTYNRNIDKIADFKLHYDWETLRQEVIANGGIRNSVLCAHMPTESSSKSTGLPNSVYPIRGIYMKKTDGSNAIDFTAKDSDLIGDNYQLAWELSVEDLYKVYGVFQKFCDHSISADTYSDRVASPELRASRLTDELMYFFKYGNKTRYYTNSKTTKSLTLDSLEEERGCVGGACSL